MLACSNENRLIKCEKAPVSAKVKRPTSGSYAEEGAASASGRKSAQPPLRSVSLGTETPPAATSSTPVASHGSQLHHEAINVVSPPWTHDTDDEDYDIESDISGEYNSYIIFQYYHLIWTFLVTTVAANEAVFWYGFRF